IARSGAFPMAGDPDVASVAPLVVTVFPDIAVARGRRDFVAVRWRRKPYNDISRRRNRDRAKRRREQHCKNCFLDVHVVILSFEYRESLTRTLHDSHPGAARLSAASARARRRFPTSRQGEKSERKRDGPCGPSPLLLTALGR